MSNDLAVKKSQLTNAVKQMSDYLKSKIDDNTNKLNEYAQSKGKAVEDVEYEGENITCENTLASRTLDMVIKGKTYQNISHVTFDNAGDFMRFDSEINKFENGFLVANSDTPATAYGDAFTKPFKTIKPNTVYTIVLDVSENTLTTAYALNTGGTYSDSTPQFPDRIDIPAGFVGRNIFTLTSAPNVNTPTGFRGFYSNGCSGKIKYRYYILEGDWTNKEVPVSITGIESAGQKENKISILSKNNKSEDDINYKQDKKEIPLPIEGGLKSLPNGVADTIEQRADGVYLVQRVYKWLIDTTSAVINSHSQNSTHVRYIMDISNLKPSENNGTTALICDKLTVADDGLFDFDNISKRNDNLRGALYITVSKDKLTTPDVAGIKQWLKDNPVTVYYELATPVETKLDINSLDLEVYENTTYVTTENNIHPNLSFKVPSDSIAMMQREINENINGLNIKNKFLFDDILGISGHRENYCNNDFTEYGFKYYRTDFEWNLIEKQKGVYDYSICDKVIRNLEAQNVIPFIILDYNNELYADNKKSAILTEDNLLAFKNFVSNLVNRYKNKNIYYEIWNEPDHPKMWISNSDSSKTYTNLVKEIYPVIKEIDPTSTVCSPALTTRYDTTWFENACKCGLLNYTDKISLHIYTTNMPENFYQRYINRYKVIIYRYSKRNIPLIISEFGYTTVPNYDGGGGNAVICTEEVRKDYIVRGILLGIMNQVDKMFVYEFRSKQTTNTNVEDWFGIVNPDYSPTSTAIAIKNLASELKGYYYIGNFSNSINDYIAGFTNGSKIKYVYWTTSNEHSNFELGISLNLTSSPQIIEFNKNIYLNYNDYKENYFENKLTEIDSMNISGRNYAHSNRYWHTRDESGTFGINYKDDITKITKLVDNNARHIYLPLVKTLDIGQYTVSFDIKNSENTKLGFDLYNITEDQSKGNIFNEDVPSNEWLHFEKIIEIKTEDVNAIFLSSTNMALNQYFEIKNIKIEKGSRATDYELAHEEFALKSDLDSFIENLTTEQLTTLKAKLDALT